MNVMKKLTNLTTTLNIKLMYPNILFDKMSTTAMVDNDAIYNFA